MLLSVSRSLDPYGDECTVGFGAGSDEAAVPPLLSPARVRGQRDLAFLVGTCSVLYSVRAEIRLPEGFAGATSLLSNPSDSHDFADWYRQRFASGPLYDACYVIPPVSTVPSVCNLLLLLYVAIH